MGLYLAIFDEDENELEGVEVGSYSDYDVLIQAVIKHVEGGRRGSVCPTLVMHHDSDGEWSSKESKILLAELAKIKELFLDTAPVAYESKWVGQVLDDVGIEPSNAFESFIDVDGEFLIDRLIELAELSISTGHPILFQ